MDKEKLNKWLTRLFAFALFIFILTFSIGLPIYFRPFYYLHINALDLPARYNSECTYEMVKDAYDEILDYLTLPGKEFGTGEFPHSHEGASHFADVKGLFTLNTVALISSTVILITLYILIRKKIFSLEKKNGHHITYYVGTRVLTVSAVIGLLASLDFTVAFERFHRIFFPGKENFAFDRELDPIIQILPERFFLNCAILILSSIIAICAGLIIYNKRKENRRD